MITALLQGGPFMVFLLLIAVGVIALTIQKFIVLFIRREKSGERGLNAILFWGGFSAVLGLLGQMLGVYFALNAIMRASDISPQIVAMGLSISYLPSLFGFYILIFSLLAWFILRARYNSLVRREK
ncbi:MotA/TolQ/ExbB proton channel family protein [candidate division KSB1 bacterium]|nr:MotA/TolQ/ExbB proton channel family protein [candidate division KSB1 bacterium]